MTPRRITFLAHEVRGSSAVGGLGTATTFLALALAKRGHHVEVVDFGVDSTGVIEPEWARRFDDAGVSVRLLPRSEDYVRSPDFVLLQDVDAFLRADSPDVVVAQDCSAPAYLALRSRSLRLAFEDTLFVVICHGTRGWIKYANRSVRFFPTVTAVTVLERASLELADAVVSPSAHLLDWMRDRGWRLPERTQVIPYLTEGAVTADPAPRAVRVNGAGRVQRVAFFGRFEERKGLRPFAAALGVLGSDVLEQLDLQFVGGEYPWTAEQVMQLIPETARTRLRGVTFETNLDQQQALEFLGKPGTLTVIPALEDNSPNTVYECLQRGIPFIASDKGGIPELIHPADRDRVLFEPTPEGIAQALRRALGDGEALRPARPAFDDSESLRRWEEVLALPARRSAPSHEHPHVDVVVVHRASPRALRRCLDALARQRYRELAVTVVLAGPHVAEPSGLEPPFALVRSESSATEAAREAALPALTGEWVCFLDEDDMPDETLIETLVRAQTASGADVVSCGFVLQEDGERARSHFFAGQPRALGVLWNWYGTTALIRRALLSRLTFSWPVEGDPDWPLLAQLSAAGAEIVSVPAPLVSRARPPGTLERHPSDALLVVEELERALPEQLASVARLAAGLAADDKGSAPVPPTGLARRVVRRALRRRRHP